jgi:sugar O-acyltransferase (sialic acid O-acetyltransferase NeuD family)
MKPVVLLGGGGHAAVVLDMLELNDYPVAGYLALTPSGLDIPYLGDDAWLANAAAADYQLALGVGSIRVSLLRQQLFERAKALGFTFVSVIHPAATVSRRATLAEGVQIMAGAVVQPGCQLAENVIINTCASVDHHSQLAAHVHIAPGARLSGDVCLEQGCHIGTGAVLIQGITLGADCLVAAGAVVTRSWPAGSRLKGVPAHEF